MNEDELLEAKKAFARWAENNPHAGDPELAFVVGWQLSAEPVRHPGTKAEPNDFLTRLCDIAARAVHDEDPSIKGVIMLEDENQDGGIVFTGYKDSIDGLASLLTHMKEMFKAHGIDFDIRNFKRKTSLPKGFSSVR